MWNMLNTLATNPHTGRSVQLMLYFYSYKYTFFLEFFNPRFIINIYYQIINFSILSLSNFNKRELNFPRRLRNNITFNSRLEKK